MHMQKLMLPIYMSVGCFACLMVVFVVFPIVLSEDSWLAWPGMAFEEWITGFGIFGRVVIFVVVFVGVCQFFRIVSIVFEENRGKIVFPWQPEFKEIIKRRQDEVRETRRAMRERQRQGLAPIGKSLHRRRRDSDSDEEPLMGKEVPMPGGDRFAV